jgi:S1-C subfamily serine protease
MMAFTVSLFAMVLTLAAQAARADTSTGTGFAVSEDGDLITNEHVISHCVRNPHGEVDAVAVRRGDRRFLGAVLVSDKTTDIAIIRLRPTALGSTPTRAFATSGVSTASSRRAGDCLRLSLNRSIIDRR